MSLTENKVRPISYPYVEDDCLLTIYQYPNTLPFSPKAIDIIKFNGTNQTKTPISAVGADQMLVSLGGNWRFQDTGNNNYQLTKPQEGLFVPSTISYEVVPEKHGAILLRALSDVDDNPEAPTFNPNTKEGIVEFVKPAIWTKDHYSYTRCVIDPDLREFPRFYVISNAIPDEPRGHHAHYENYQVMYCVKKSIKAVINNGRIEQIVTLDPTTDGAVIEPFDWHEMHDFKSGTILLVLASKKYDPHDYMRDRTEWEKIVSLRGLSTQPIV